MNITTLTIPGSKSITNRALIMAALCKQSSVLNNILISDDTETCQEALKNLFTSKIINCNDAGTVARFLLPICAALGGEYHFDGSSRMRERPIGPLLDILKQQKVEFKFLESPDKMPFIMKSNGLIGGKISVDVHDSSQFLSGLLMAAPLTKTGFIIQAIVHANPNSDLNTDLNPQDISQKPYIQMTLHLMEKFGIKHELMNDSTIEILPGTYQAPSLALDIEPDASTASYFFAAAALNQGCIRILHLSTQSIQGDLKFLKLLEEMGCLVEKGNMSDIKQKTSYIQVTGPKTLKGIGEVNMSGFTDTFMTLAIIAPFLPTPTTIHGLRHTRLQESDRVAAIVDGLTHVGIKTESTEDSLTIFPGHPSILRPSIPGQPKPIIIDSHNDHRIAMSFAILGLKIPGIMMNNPECVSKTCPSFFELLALLKK